MTSQLCRNFHASQAVHGADDITTPNFKSQVSSMSLCSPQIALLFTAEGWSAQLNSINFETHPQSFLNIHAQIICTISWHSLPQHLKNAAIGFADYALASFTHSSFF